MKKYNDFLNFMKTLSSKNLESVLCDYKLIQDSEIKIFYVLDTYDIINYTLPFVDSNAMNKNREDFSQHTIAYETVFSNKESFNFSILDEYKEELININNNLTHKLNNFPKVKEKFFNILKNDIPNNPDDNEINNLFIQNNIEAFTVLYIFLVHGTNIYDRFNLFLKDRLNIDTFISNDKVLDEKINLLFQEIRKSNLTDAIFDKFIEKYALKLSSLNTEYDKYCYLENTYRDISVIDRVINLNKTLKEKKVYFHYLSSAPQKTSRIFNILDGENKENNINRNIMQLYLLNFVKSTYENKDEGIIFLQTLKHLKEMISDKSTAESFSFNSNFNKIIESIVERFSDDKKKLEKKFFFKIYFQYKKKFENLIQQKNQNNEIVKYLNNFNSSLKENLNNNLIINQPLFLMENIMQTYTLGKKFVDDKTDYKIIKTPLGKDIIRNSFHHLPLLFFYSFDNNNFSSFYALLNNISNHPNNEGLSIEIFNNLINNILQTKPSGKDSQIAYDLQYIILNFLNLITSRMEVNNNNLLEFSEEEICENLEKFKKIKFYSYGKNRIIENEEKNLQLIYEGQKSILDKEIDYFLLWLYRRSKKYEKAEELFIQSDYENIENDPRFNHGIGLVYHSKAYEYIEESNSDSEKMFVKSIEFLEKAMIQYSKIDKSEFGINLQQILIKQELGILNTIIDANLKLFSINNHITESKIFQLRDYLRLIKIKFDQTLPHVNYNSFATFNHTEADLEYYETILLIEQEKYVLALQKISHCTKRTHFFKDCQYLTKDRFNELSKKTTEARVKILEALNYL